MKPYLPYLDSNDFLQLSLSRYLRKRLVKGKKIGSLWLHVATSESLSFKSIEWLRPHYLEDILKFYHQSRTLRSSRDHLRLEEPNFNMKTYGQRAFSVAAPRLWNKLPFEIRACSDVNLYKSKLKTFLFKNVYDI